MVFNIGGVRRIVITIILFVLAITILLNFIPIKFAIKLEDAQQKLEAGRYICVADYKSKVAYQSEWFASTRFNSHLEGWLVLRLTGNSPNRYLSEKDFESFEVDNKFLLNGNVERIEKITPEVLDTHLNVDDWEIVYPIERASFRKHFTPRSYLNIYDYDMIKLIRSLW
ncbi:MAG: hypothetical protein P0Y55_07895 [Candidatus Cohnella colombiensis]|uniref:Uncharacterized protein n=1 Tax=Candidatus Cohnella colombiensis TaxID=3121368 RepID=A0AA95JD57_9BACL|nr:MAG: hypothetical protein P0Y55_07895 [Cohnella sp.]